MKIQLTSKRIGVATAGLAMFCAAGMAQAQSAGDNVVTFGWIHVMPQNHYTPLTVTSIGGMPVNLVQTGTGFSAQKADTFGLNFAHFFTDNISVEAVGGFPSDLKFQGEGSLKHFGVIGQAKPLAPTVFVRYHFLDANAKLRPYVGLGINYTKFVQGEVTNSSFVESIAGPGSSGTVSASSSWNPAFTAGLNYALDDHWSVGLALSYIPVKSTATLTITSASGTKIVANGTDKIRPVTTFLNVGYRF